MADNQQIPSVTYVAADTVVNRGWTVTMAGAGINVILGVLYAWSVIGKAIGAQWNWTATQRVMPFAISTAVFALTMIFAGWIQDRIGPKKVAMLGGLLLGLGMIGSSFTKDPMLMLLTFGVLGGMGIGIGYAATTPPAIKWFPPARRGLISGIVVAGVGLAAVFMSPVTQFLLAKTTISNTFLILGIFTIVAIGLLAQLLTNPPEDFKPVPAAGGNIAKAAPAGRRNLDWNQMLKTPQFYGMWLMYVLSAAPGLMIISNAASIAKEQASWENGFIVVMVLAAFNTTGRVAGGYVSDRIGRRATMVLAFLCQAANMLMFVHYTTPTLLLTGAALTGLFYGAFFALMPAAAADFYGLKHMGVNYGLIFTGFGVAGVLGSWLGAKVSQLFGSYGKAYQIMAVMLVVSALLAFLTRAPKMVEPEKARDMERAGA